MTEAARLLEALHFSADRHRDQRRKGASRAPYINHPIEVAHVLAGVGEVTDLDTLLAAILHDTIEDTGTSAEELVSRFGRTVGGLVEEVTDDKRLPKDERKRRQIQHAAHASPGAKQIKLADKICNVRDVTHAPPSDWSHERRVAYLDWTEQVVAGCRGVNPALERHYDEVLRAGRLVLGA